VSDEVQFVGRQTAAAEDLPAQLLGTAPNRGRRLGPAADDPRLDAAATKGAFEAFLDPLEVAHRSHGGEAEEARHEEHDLLLAHALPVCGRAAAGVV